MTEAEKWLDLGRDMIFLLNRRFSPLQTAYAAWEAELPVHVLHDGRAARVLIGIF